MLIEKRLCTGCGACLNACPKNAIVMKPFEDGFLYPEIDGSLCINCGLCEKVCPVTEREQEELVDKPAFALKNKDEQIRLYSSSGGAFSLLAEEILGEDGLCIGAALDDSLAVKHVALGVEEIGAFRGSKYTQSDIGTTYRLAKEQLLSGKRVLFSGTPCQIAGLKGYLGKDYENLTTVDFICHGVPSANLWRGYLECCEEHEGSVAVSASFRDKTYGWKLFSMKTQFQNGETRVEKITKDPYLRAFLSNLFLRPACFKCKFRGNHYQSDITLADFWGIDKIMPEINDDKGVSLVIVNTKKGEAAISLLQEKAELYPVELKAAIKGNPSYHKSCEASALNRKALRDSTKMPFKKLFKKYCEITLLKRIKRKIARMLAR